MELADRARLRLDRSSAHVKQASVVVRPGGEVEDGREFPKHIAPEELGQRIAAINEAADHRMSLMMDVVLRHRIDEPRRDRADRLALREAVGVAVMVEKQCPFLDRPAVVPAPDDEIDLLDVVLSDVADE